jgi:transcriptional regulator with XRE-family HTH domain
VNGQQSEPTIIAELIETTTKLMGRLREGAGLEQQELATHLYTSPTTLSRFESNGLAHPNLAMFFSICTALKVRQSAVLRIVEESIPVGGAPWTVSPHDLLAAYAEKLSQR